MRVDTPLHRAAEQQTQSHGQQPGPRPPTLALLACPADRFLMARAAAWPPESPPPRSSSISPAIIASRGWERSLRGWQGWQEGVRQADRWARVRPGATTGKECRARRRQAGKRCKRRIWLLCSGAARRPAPPPAQAGRPPASTLRSRSPQLRANIGAAGQVGEGPGCGLTAAAAAPAARVQQVGQRGQRVLPHYLLLRLLAVACNVAAGRAGVGERPSELLK